MDFETYSEAGYVFDESCGYFKPLMKGKPGIACVNAPVYAEHPSARVISLAYNLLDGCGVRLWTPISGGPVPLFNYLQSGNLIEAHNSGFEYYIWFYVCQQRMGWPELPLHQLRCSAAKARAWGLPGSLEKVAGIVTPGRGKDPRGKKLIQLLSIPKKPTKACSELYRSFEKYPELHYEMYEYNDQDVVAEQDVSSRMPEMSEFETRVWLLDQEINVRGVAIDLEGLEACVRLFHLSSNKYTAELQRITGGEVQTVDEVSKTSAGDKWLQSRGFDFPSLDKQTVEDSLERADLPPDVRRVLEIRQAIGGAAVKKLFAMQRCLNSDGRIRDSFVYCGAERTGRFAGRQIQPQNFRNGGPEENGMEWGNTLAERALVDIHNGDLEQIESRWGNAIDLIGSCMRSLLVAGPGKELICSDYSAIEAVVLAALAGEEWRLEVFRTHGKIYEMSAAKITGVPFKDIMAHAGYTDLVTPGWWKIEQTGKHHPLRKKIGKIAELGCFGPETPVLTGRGWVPISRITAEDVIHDGVTFVGHEGVVYKGHRKVIDLHGVSVTPDHKFYIRINLWENASRLYNSKTLFQKAVSVAHKSVKGFLHVTKPVLDFKPQSDTYDILNCGPRNRYVILTDRGPLIAHNSGYGGWINAWLNFGAGAFMTEEEIKTGILAWREASPAIVELWGGQWRKVMGRWEFYREFYGIEGMTVLAIANPGTEYTYRDLKFGVFGDVLYIRLPSGRCLSYHEPRLNVGTDPRGQEVQQISFMGMDGYTHKWSRILTHGAKLAENITQGAARDILAAALVRVNAAGYPPVLHVHDEIVSEVPIGFGSVEEFEQLMEVREPWFADWPISASGGWRGHRYRK